MQGQSQLKALNPPLEKQVCKKSTGVKVPDKELLREDAEDKVNQIGKTGPLRGFSDVETQARLARLMPQALVERASKDPLVVDLEDELKPQ